MSRLQRPRLALTVAATLVAVAGYAADVAQAQPAPAASGAWASSHPRRAEVNARLANQNRRIQQQEAAGKISAAEAAQLHHRDRRIRQQERAMASRDGGHITRGEQRALNARENQVSREIGH